jgi:hypothetical protein
VSTLLFLCNTHLYFPRYSQMYCKQQYHRAVRGTSAVYALTTKTYSELGHLHKSSFLQTTMLEMTLGTVKNSVSVCSSSVVQK